MADATPGSTTPSSNRNIMIVLSYLWLLALVPLLTEKNDKEVQWHAKHGIVLMLAEMVLWAGYLVILSVPGLGCIAGIFLPIVWLASIILRIVCMMKGVNGQRLIIPGLSEFADKF